MHLVEVNWVKISVVLIEFFWLNNWNILWRHKGMQVQENIQWWIITLRLVLINKIISKLIMKIFKNNIYKAKQLKKIWKIK